MWRAVDEAIDVSEILSDVVALGQELGQPDLLSRFHLFDTELHGGFGIKDETTNGGRMAIAGLRIGAINAHQRFAGLLFTGNNRDPARRLIESICPCSRGGVRLEVSPWPARSSIWWKTCGGSNLRKIPQPRQEVDVMKKFIVLFLVTAISLIASPVTGLEWQATSPGCCSLEPATNLLLNPGFEDDDGSGRPAYWSVRPDPPPPGGTFAWDAAAFHSGARSVRIEATAQVTQTLRWYQVVSVQPNVDYDLSGYLKTEGVVGSGAYLQLAFLDGAGQVISATATAHRTGDLAWQEAALRAKSPSNAAQAAIAPSLDGAGKAWFDDLSLTRADWDTVSK